MSLTDPIEKMMRTPFLLLLLLVVVVGGVTLWLLDEDTAPAAVPELVVGIARDDEPTTAPLPRPRDDGAVVPLELPLPAVDVAGQRDAGTPAADSVSAGSRTFTGRLLTADGLPRANAEVAWLPGTDTLLAAGHVEPPHVPDDFPRRSLDDLRPFMPTTRSGPDGRFSLTVDESSPSAGDPRSDGGPILVVGCPDALVLLPPRAEALGDLVICSDGPFSVDVVDEAGRPVAGAWAEVVLGWSARPACAGEEQAADVMKLSPRTGRDVVIPLRVASGARFERNDLPLVYGSLVAGAPGHATVTRSLRSNRRTAEQAPLVLPRAGRFAGRVLAPDGSPLPGALVTITGHPGTNYPVHHGGEFRPDDDSLLLALAGSSHSATKTALSDSDGRFSFDDLPARTHDVFVQADGCNPLRERDVLPDGSPIELRMAPSRRLEVLVRDQRGRPVEDACVEAWRGVMNDLNVLEVEAPTEVIRPFVVWGASERVTTVRASAPWHGVVAEQVFDGAPSLHLVLPPAGAVEVVVRDADGPLADIEVKAWRLRQDPDQVREWRIGLEPVTTGADGGALFENLEPGSVYFGAGDWASRSLDFGEPVKVDVHAGELSTAVIEARSKAVVRGRVLGATGKVAVRFAREGQMMARVKTSDDGTFTTQLAAGTHQVGVNGESVASITVEPGEERDIELRAPRGARVEGRLTSGGQGLSGWIVSVYGAAQVPDQTTDDQGRFAFELPAGGRWTPMIRFPPKGGSGRRQGPRLDALEIDPGGVALLDIELPSASIVVRTVDREGLPATKLGVTFRRVDDGADWTSKSGIRIGPDTEGVARADFLEPGTWLAEVAHGWKWVARAGVPFELADGEVHIEPDLVLDRACTVKGRAFAAPGVLVGDDVMVLLANSDGEREHTYLDSTGDFDITWLSPGRWQIVLATEGGSTDEIVIPPGAGRSVDLASGDEVEIELVMTPLR